MRTVSPMFRCRQQRQIKDTLGFAAAIRQSFALRRDAKHYMSQLGSEIEADRRIPARAVAPAKGAKNIATCNLYLAQMHCHVVQLVAPAPLPFWNRRLASDNVP